MHTRFNNKKIFIGMLIFCDICMHACSTHRKTIAVDVQLKNDTIIQPYINNPNYKVEFHDTDILWQRRNLGKKYECMYLLSNTRDANTIDSLALFEVTNNNNKGTIAFPRTPSPLTALMNAYYPISDTKVYANTIAEMLNYLQTGYAQKTWITVLDTHLCDKSWTKKRLTQKIYVIKTQ